MLGHKSAAVTLAVYADLWDSDLVSVAGAMEAARTAAVGAHNLNTTDVNAGDRSRSHGVVVPLHGDRILL